MRSGWLSVAVDLCKLAGLPPIGVGFASWSTTPAASCVAPQVSSFADEHGLKLVSVADLIAYRQRKETLIQLQASFDVETPLGKAGRTAIRRPGTRCSISPWSSAIFVTASTFRCACTISVVDDLFGKRSVDHYMKIAEKGRGVIVYLREVRLGAGYQDNGRRLSAKAAKPMRSAETVKANGLEIGLGVILAISASARSSFLTAASATMSASKASGIKIAETEIG